VYLYRAVDAAGKTLEFLLNPTRDAEAAKRFFLKALQLATGSSPSQDHLPQEPMNEPLAEDTTQPAASGVRRTIPRVINVDKNAAYPKAIADLKAAGLLPGAVELRQVKYRGNLIEQDHRFIKRLTKPGLGFFSFRTAWRTLQGFEVMNMIRKGQRLCCKKEADLVKLEKREQEGLSW
jgi:transposase-like protein